MRRRGETRTSPAPARSSQTLPAWPSARRAKRRGPARRAVARLVFLGRRRGLCGAPTWGRGMRPGSLGGLRPQRRAPGRVIAHARPAPGSPRGGLRAASLEPAGCEEGKCPLSDPKPDISVSRQALSATCVLSPLLVKTIPLASVPSATRGAVPKGAGPTASEAFSSGHSPDAAAAIFVLC